MTSEPPPASSWATPPEFYCDENITTRSVRRFLVDLGYVVHTPAELFGSREAALGTSDEVWLAKVDPQPRRLPLAVSAPVLASPGTRCLPLVDERGGVRAR